MSIASKITELNKVKTDLKEAIYEVSTNTTGLDTAGLVEYPSYVEGITPWVSPAEPKDVNFIDYDGTLVYAFTKAEFLAYNMLPPGPHHKGLVFEEWNWRLTEIKEYLQDDFRVDVGANYITDDGWTRIYIHKEEGHTLYHLIAFYNASAINVDWDWGDGTTYTESVASGDHTQYYMHLYEKPGDYVIRIKPSGSLMFGQNGGTSAGAITYSSLTGHYRDNADMFNCVQKVELGQNIILTCNAFYQHQRMKSISISKTTTNLSTYPARFKAVFQACRKLGTVVLPHGWTVISNQAMYSMTETKYIPLPPTIEMSGSYGSEFRYDICLDYILIPKTTTTIGDYALGDCRSLRYIKFHSGMTNIKRALQSNMSLRRIEFMNNTCQWSYIQTMPALTGIKVNEGATSMVASACSGCFSAYTIDLPSTLTSIATKAFQNCYRCTTIIVRATTPPSLENVDAFTGFTVTGSGSSVKASGLNGTQKMYVPYSEDHSILNAYKTAENWINFADYMYELDENGNIPTT